MRAPPLLLLAIALAAFLHSLLASPAFAEHEARFRGQGAAAQDIGLIVWTVVGAILGFGALIAIVLFWERREEAAQGGQNEVRQGKGEI